MADQPTSPTPPTDASAEQWLDLALRLLAALYRCDYEQLRLLPDRLPDDLPFALPLPEDVRVLGALSLGQSDLPNHHPPLAIMLVETPQTAEQGAQRLSATLEAQGWIPSAPHMRGGFAHVVPNHSLMRFGSASGDYALTVAPLPGASAQPATFWIMAQRDWPQQLHGAFRDQRELIPALLPPAGAAQQGGGCGGGNGRFYSTANLSTEAPITAVMANYDRQLERANWQRRSGETSGSVGGSYWSFTDNEGVKWRGSLAVLGDPDRPRDYLSFIQIETDASTDRNGLVGWQSHSFVKG
jgi:hypothetical protein